MDKIRYWLLGKQIQKQMVKAEQAGRDAANWEYTENLKEISRQYSRDIESATNEKLSRMDHLVNPDDVLTASYLPDGTTKMVLLNNEQLNGQEIRNLKNEVSLYKNGRLWKIMNSTLKKQAEDIMFVKASSFEDMRAGKSMLRTLDIQKNIMETIEKA